MSIEIIHMRQHNILNDMSVMGNIAANKSSNMQANAHSGVSFKDAISSQIKKVNDIQLESSATSKAYVQGDPNVSIAQVLATSSKSSVAFEALRQTHTKVFEAYKDILNLQL